MDEEIRQAIEQAKEQLPVEIDLKWYQGVIKLDEVKQYIRANINSASRSFVAIGYYLKYIRDNQLYKQDGYETIWELAQSEFGFSQSWASRCMLINDRFSKDGNSPIILDQYKGFDKSKLSEMLTLSDQQLEQVTIGTTVAEIKDIKRSEKFYATSHKESEQEPPKPSYLKCAAYDFYKFGKGCTGCFYDKPENNCPYDRTEYFADIKRQDEHRVRCEVIKEMCDSICKNRSAILEKNNYSTEAIKSVSRGDQDFSFGFGDDGSSHSKYDAEYKAKTNRYHVKEFDGSGKWMFEAGEVEQQIWNFNGNQWRRDHQKMNEQPEAVNDVDETVDNDPDIVDEPLLSETDELILDCYNEEEGWHEEIVSVEHDQVETVQADIIQTVPDDPEQYTYQDIKDEHDKLTEYVDVFRRNNDTVPGRRKAKMRLDAITLLDNEMRKPPVIEQPKLVQPELPILKNNDQRKDFIDTYETWPIWIDQKETGERYYRYNLTDKVAMVVKVSLRHVWNHLTKKSEIEYSVPQYYLLGIKADYNSKVTFTEDDTRTFYECSSNMTMLADYLKDLQKKGA